MSWTRIGAGLVGLAIAVAMAWFTAASEPSEHAHFSVNVPQAAADDVPGGLGEFGREERVVVDLGGMGAAKRLLQPALIRLSADWLRNVGEGDLEIELVMAETTAPLGPVAIEWGSDQKAFDVGTHRLGRALAAGESVRVDWVVRLPGRAWAPAPDSSSETQMPDTVGGVLAWAGALEVREAATGSLLTRLPIVIGWDLSKERIDTCCGPR